MTIQTTRLLATAHTELDFLCHGPQGEGIHLQYIYIPNYANLYMLNMT